MLNVIIHKRTEKQNHNEVYHLIPTRIVIITKNRKYQMLASKKEIWNVCALLVEVQNSAVIKENSMELP
jgi:hypothetical protein